MKLEKSLILRLRNISERVISDQAVAELPNEVARLMAEV